MVYNPKDGTRTSTIAVGESQKSVAHDGSFVWVAGIFTGNVKKIRPSDGAIVFTKTPCKDKCVYLAFDGNDMWALGSDRGLRRLHPDDAFVMEQVPSVVGSAMVFDGVKFRNVTTDGAFDGKHIWSLGTGDTSGTVFKTSK